VNETKIWWDGRDVATQTSFAWKNNYFKNDDPDNNILSNGDLTLDFSNREMVKATIDSVSSFSEFLRINGRSPIYGSALSYTIHHGIVRDVIQQEPEWGGGITGCPNIYSHIVITLPANSNYFTFSLRTQFLSSEQDRDISDLSLIQLYVDRGAALTEDGINVENLPIPSTSPPNVFYDGGSAWAHHWSEFINSENKGSGIIFRDLTNTKLYAFDDFVGDKTGALELFTSGRRIEMNPISRFDVNDFQDMYDITWHGAVVTFGSGNSDETIFPYEVSYTTDELYQGLWIIVEHPPTVIFN
jgi:hypothetical protein